MAPTSNQAVATELITIDASRAQPLGGRYRLEEVVGRGGMGTVYRALDLRLNRTVAVKVLRSVERADANRFEAEIQILARLVHPGLVRLLDAGDLESRPYLVMDMIEGPSLADSLSAGPLGREITASIGSRVANALAYVHGAGVIHRDVKPANVLLSAGGEAHLADFGIARLVDSTSITVTGRPLGTPAYLAPEQVEGTTVGPATDVYALGLVLIECLSGRRAFEGSPSEIAAQRLHRDPGVPWEVGEGWRHTLASMTRRSPADRISALDAAAQLDALARVDAYIAMITDPWDDVAVTVPLTRRDPPAPSETATQVLAEPFVKLPDREPRRRRRSRHAREIVTGAAALVLVAGLAAGATWLLTPSPAKGTLASHVKSHTVAGPTTTTTTLTASNPRVLAVTSAASALDAAINAGENNGTIDVAAGQSLAHDVSAVSTSTTPSGTSSAQLNQVVQQFQSDVQSAQIVSGPTIAAVTTAIDNLATAMGSGVSVTTSVTAPRPTGSSGPGPGPGFGHGHGRGHNH